MQEYSWQEFVENLGKARDKANERKEQLKNQPKSQPSQLKQMTNEKLAEQLVEKIGKGLIGKTDLLIISVGKGSPEQVLAAIVIHKPKTLCLVHTDQSKEDAIFAEEFASSIGVENVIKCLISQTNPAEMYKELRKLWENELSKKFTKDSRIAIDITGGKKTMTYGSLQFNAIIPRDQYGAVRMYYLDFNDYEVVNRGPQFEDNFYEELTNPAEIYLFDELRELNSLFAGRYYTAATELAKRIVEDKIKKFKDYYNPDAEGHWEKAITYLEALDKWYSQADYKKAWEGLKDLEREDFPEPSAIKHLGDKPNLKLDDLPKGSEETEWENYLIHLIDEFHRALFIGLYEEEYTRAYLESARILELSARFLYQRYKEPSNQPTDTKINEDSWHKVEKWLQKNKNLFSAIHYTEVDNVRQLRNKLTHRTVRSGWEDDTERVPGLRSALQLAHQRLERICNKPDFNHLTSHLKICNKLDFNHLTSHLKIGFDPLNKDFYLHDVKGKEKFKTFLDGLSKEAQAYYPPLDLNLEKLI
jgi:hypothetical protein